MLHQRKEQSVILNHICRIHIKKANCSQDEKEKEDQEWQDDMLACEWKSIVYSLT